MPPRTREIPPSKSNTRSLRARGYQHSCVDCGKLCTGQRCMACAGLHRRTGLTHGTWSCYAKGCRCNECKRAAQEYNLQRYGKTGVTCGTQWQYNPGQSYQEHDQCQQCRTPPPRCDCGELMSHGSKRCITCWRSGQTLGGRRKQSLLSSGKWRRLRDLVVAEEPECQIRTGRCTGKSETADHVIPVSVRPDLIYVRENLRGACHACNMAIWRQQVAEARGSVRALTFAGTPWELPPPNRGPWKPKPLAVYSRCQVCGDWCRSGNASCSKCCREWSGRRARDRYRARVGIPFNHNEPTTRRNPECAV